QAAVTRSLRNVKVAFCLAAVIGVTVLVNIAPSILYSVQHGRNPALANRSPFEAETYGLKVLKLILPIRNHRLPIMQFIRTGWGTPIGQTEADFSSVGLVASIGLAILLLGALVGFPARGRNNQFAHLSFLTVLSIVIGATGGLGPVFAYFVSPQIRAYNRISIYIAFFCLAAFLIALEAILQLLTARTGRITRYAVLTGTASVVLVAGVLDQTDARTPFAIPAVEAHMRAIDAFVGSLEERLPKGAIILQLPYMPFPESGPINSLNDYEPLKAYLASKTLRWSYGMPRGRYDDGWLKD